MIHFRCKSLLVLLVLGCEMLHAQRVEQNLKKYWTYRHKLVTQYMLIGDGQGYSQPASYINPGLERMKWSDNTIWLGWYLGTLATEYHLLHNQRYAGYDERDNSRVEQNRTELYFALRALIRLDSMAETSFTWNVACGIPNQRNGFFIRDDVPANFTDSFPGYNVVDADFVEQNFANEMSQDQAYHVLLGLALVRAFVPDTVVINGTNIRAEAQTQIALIGNWIHDDGWLIKNPACSNKNVDRGHDASLLAKGLNLTLKFLTNNQLDFSSDVSGTADFVWNSLATPSPIVTTDNLHMTMTLASIGQGWGNGTLDELVALADTNKWFAYPLLYVALRDTQSVSNYTQHKPLMMFWSDSMLNEAPITGPLSTYPQQNGHGYGVNNRFIRPRVNHYAGVNPNEAGHQWNGLDYMLLHNLRLIVDPAIWPETISDTTDTTGIAGQVIDPFSIYPNPASDRVVVETTYYQQGSTVQVFNTLGKRVLQQTVYGQRTLLDFSGKCAGVYFVQAGGQVQRLVLR